MAPDFAQGDDAPPNLTGKALLAFAQIFAATAVLVFAFYEAMTWLKAHHASYAMMMGASAVYVILIIALVAVWSRSVAMKMCITVTPAAKRYRRRTLISSSAYGATLFLAVGLNGQHLVDGLLAYAVAVLPGIAVTGMFVAMGLYLREETDEFQRSVQIESGLWATGIVMMICAIWGFLEMFHLAPHVEAWVVVPVWALVHGFANIFTRRRYQ